MPVSPTMVFFLFVAAQAAAPADIDLRASVRARSLTIEKHGTASVQVTADGQNVVSVEAPKADGRKRINNPVINVNIQARIADPRLATRPETRGRTGPDRTDFFIQ